MLPVGGWQLCPLEEWPLIGAVPKNYLAYGDPEDPNCVAYIAKKGRQLDGRLRECVTEEIISKIGSMLPVRIARSKLVRLPVPPGAQPDVRFLSRDFVRRGQEQLLHGAEIFAQYLGTRQEELSAVFNLDDKNAEREFYTISNVVDVLDGFSRNARERGELLSGFARMLTFDAFVGAQDRHALNWGVLQPLTGGGDVRFAPLFDTARGLFREHTDSKLRDIEAAGHTEAKIRDYAARSRPVFGAGRRNITNHFELLDVAIECFPTELGHTIRTFVRSINVPDIKRMLQRRFRRIVTPIRLDFIVRLLQHRYLRLLTIVERSEK